PGGPGDVVARQGATPIANPIFRVGLDVRHRDVPWSGEADRIVHGRLHDDAVRPAVLAFDALPYLDALELCAVVGIPTQVVRRLDGGRPDDELVAVPETDRTTQQRA